jgi:hypothetical protein
VWVAGEDYLEQVQFPMHTTYDSGRTPKQGETLANVKLKPIDLGAIQTALAIKVDESTPSATKTSPADATEIARLRAEVADLRKSKSNLVQAVLSNGRFHVRVEEKVREIANQIQGLFRSIDEAQTMLQVAKVDSAPSSADERPAEPQVAHPQPATAPHRAPAPEMASAPVMEAQDGEIQPPKGRARQVLHVLDEMLDQHPKLRERGVKEKTWAFLAGIDRKSSTWRGHKAALRGYFVQNGDRVTLSPVGKVLFDGERGGPRPAISVGEGLVRSFAHTIKPGGAGLILLELLRAWPESATRAQLAAASDAPMSSSTFRGYLAPLNTLELVEKDGQNYRLAPELMEW